MPSSKPVIKPRRARETPRVEDSGSSSSANNKTAVHRGATTGVGVPIGANGLPMIEIIAQASELVPVAQYANVTIGPVAVRRWVEDTGDDSDLSASIAACQEVVQGIIADDREAVEESVRLHNQRVAEDEAKEAKKRGR